MSGPERETPYIYIGKDGKPILARDLEDQRDAAIAETTRLKKAIAEKGGTENFPTQYAYERACAAIEKHRTRAEKAEARWFRKGIGAALQAIADLPTGRTEDVMEGQEQAFRAVEALKGDQK